MGVDAAVADPLAAATGELTSQSDDGGGVMFVTAVVNQKGLRIEADLAEMKADLKTLLRRAGP